AQSLGFADFRNRVDGVVDIQADFAFLHWFSNGPCSNEGLFRKSGGAGDANIVCSVTNTGEFRSESGRMVFPNAVNTYTQNAGATVLAGGGIVVSSMTLNAGALRGAGQLSANVVNNGASVEPGASPGILEIVANATPSIAGNYTQNAGATLVIEVGGLTPGSEHDQVLIDGAATLAGTLEFRQLNGFEPSQGDALTVLTAGTLAGAFDDVVLTGFPTSITAVTSVQGNSVVVTFANTGGGQNSNTNSNANDNSVDNTNDNTANNDNVNSDNSNDNTGAPQMTPDSMTDCGSGACGAGAPMLTLSMIVFLGARRRRIHR
ncbi:MAG: hypothetical protein KDA33_14950, partial [Phycisphaerales bacterium]|nr:hypothetical protein [Phycisphaerales bacterium]